MTNSTPSMSISTDASAKILPNFTGLTDTTVIETMPAEALYANVAAGETDMGFNQISEVLAQPTVEFAGGLPLAIQNYTQFAAVIVSGSSQTDAGRALVTFLSSPAAQTVLKAKGFE